MEGEPHAGPPASVVVRLGTTTTTSGSPAATVVAFFLFGFPPELQVQRAATTTQLRPPTPNPLILRSLVFYLVTRRRRRRRAREGIQHSDIDPLAALLITHPGRATEPRLRRQLPPPGGALLPLFVDGAQPLLSHLLLPRSLVLVRFLHQSSLAVRQRRARQHRIERALPLFLVGVDGPPPAGGVGAAGAAAEEQLGEVAGDEVRGAEGDAVARPGQGARRGRGH